MLSQLFEGVMNVNTSQERKPPEVDQNCVRNRYKQKLVPKLLKDDMKCLIPITPAAAGRNAAGDRLGARAKAMRRSGRPAAAPPSDSARWRWWWWWRRLQSLPRLSTVAVEAAVSPAPFYGGCGDISLQKHRRPCQRDQLYAGTARVAPAQLEFLQYRSPRGGAGTAPTAALGGALAVGACGRRRKRGGGVRGWRDQTGQGRGGGGGVRWAEEMGRRGLFTSVSVVAAVSAAPLHRGQFAGNAETRLREKGARKTRPLFSGSGKARLPKVQAGPPPCLDLITRKSLMILPAGRARPLLAQPMARRALGG